MSRLTLDAYFTGIAKLVAARATCPRRQVGCVLVSTENHILATGYNGVPKGMVHCTDTPCPGAQYTTGKGLDKCKAVHAEINAIEQCANASAAQIAYITTSPCYACTMRLIRDTPIKHLVFIDAHISWNKVKTLWESTGRTWEQSK